MNLKATKADDFSFRRGYYSLPNKMMEEFRLTVMNALNISKESFYRRMRGETELRVTEVEYIKGLFKKYGITEIWGDK